MTIQSLLTVIWRVLLKKKVMLKFRRRYPFIYPDASWGVAAHPLLERLKSPLKPIKGARKGVGISHRELKVIVPVVASTGGITESHIEN